MGNAKRLLYKLLFVAVLVVVALVVLNNYSYIFSRHVRGEIVDVARVNAPMAIVNSGSGAVGNEALFSFAVAIRDEDGVIHSASSEDRQWAIAKPGFCADAVFYPYPFWNLEKRGTYMNARLIQLSDCPAGMKRFSTPAQVPAAQTAPAAQVPAAQPVATPAAH